MTETPTLRRWRLPVEAVLIVLSILAAFAIDAWWADRKEAQNLELALVGIAAGLSESQASIDQHIEGVSSALTRLRAFITMGPSQAGQIPADETGDYLEPIHRPYTQDNNLTFLRVALDDEVLKEVDDRAFQAALVEWREAVNQLDEIDGALSAHWIEALAAVGWHEEVGRVFAADAVAVEAEVLGRLRADPAVFSLAARKSVLMRRQLAFLPQLAEAEATLLKTIETRLTR